MNTKVNLYLEEGCGRCSLWRTAECKVHTWQDELHALRALLLDSGLKEELKWSQPCYTFQKKNIVLLSAFKEYCALSFFKGSLLKDPQSLLVQPGEHSQATRQFRFTRAQDIAALEATLKAYIAEAIELEKTGAKVVFKKNPEPIPAELQDKWDELPALQDAFEALTPGRQRGYILYFSAPKQSKTRTSRIEKCLPKIFEGRGLNDR